MLQPVQPAWVGLHGSIAVWSTMARLAQRVRDFWFAITGQPAAPQAPPPEVIVHDPGAEGPRDLDDPFFDPKVQSRMAGVIADNAAKKN